MPPKKANKFNIQERELAKCLSISLERLDEIVDFFDSDSEDEWQLNENFDYIFLNQKDKSRMYAASGALKIAEYLDAHEERGIIQKIKEFITRYQQRLRRSLARRTISEELLYRVDDPNKARLKIKDGNKVIIYKQSLRRILGTNGATMKRAFQGIQRSSVPLEVEKDFYVIEGKHWYSSYATTRFADYLGANLTSKSRQMMCKDISAVLEPSLDNILKTLTAAERQWQKDVETAKRRAKKRDKHTCQITGNKSTKYNKFSVAAHHFYDVQRFPELATIDENIITIKEEIHEQFHGWMGGNKHGCDIDDFIDFVSSVYPDESDRLVTCLYHKKQKILSLRVSNF